MSSIKSKIRGVLKNNIAIYKIYYCLGSFGLRFLGLFISIDKKTILLNSFAGKKYDDSTKAIYEYMIRSKKYRDYKIYWALDDMTIKIPRPAIKVKNDSFKYFVIALKSKYWITNSAIERGLKFKKKKTIYINTWHGSAIKAGGVDIDKKNYRFNHSQYDYMYAQSKFDVDTFSHIFEVPRDRFALVGLPRNDELALTTKKRVKEIKKRIGVPLNKKVILYAPTFREYNRRNNKVIGGLPISLEKWKNVLGDDYCLILRAHYEVSNSFDIENDGFAYDFTNYEKLNELLMISDVLISDYSSIMIDYSILERPIFAYTYDLEEYKRNRGLNINLDNEIPNGCIKDENELIKRIKTIDWESQKRKTQKFRQKYVEKYGNASSYIDTIILGEKWDD